MMGLLYDEMERGHWTGVTFRVLDFTSSCMTDFSPWQQFGGWDHTLPLDVDDVVARWWRILSCEAPWLAMTADDRWETMRPLVAELVSQARDPDEDERTRRLAALAFEHGAFRAAQRLRASSLMRWPASIRRWRWRSGLP